MVRGITCGRRSSRGADDRCGQQWANHVRGAKGGAEEGRRHPSGIGDLHAELLMQAADVDNNGTIDYGEFIPVTLHLNKLERDSSVYITADELQVVCKEFGLGDVKLEDMIGEVDQDKMMQ